jgi:superfamily II DNA or RNA helicase
MKTLYPHQQELKAKIRIAFAKYRRVCGILPTGGGKSAVAASIIGDSVARGRRVWILAHRRKLIAQLSATLDEEGIEHGRIQPKQPRTNHPVQVGSVDTVIGRLDELEPPDFIIVDEAHHLCENNKWGKVVNHFPDAYLLGLTATFCRLDGRGLGEGHGGYFQYMVLGKSAEWLTDNGYLAEAIIHTWPPLLGKDNRKRRAGDIAPEAAAAAVDKPAIMGDVILQYRKHLDGKTAIANCCTVRHAENVAAAFNAAGITAAAITGKTAKDEQDRLFDALKIGELKILCQCELISEGVDIPSVSGGLMLRTTESLTLWLQQCGRTLRRKPDGSRAIILDFVGNARNPDLGAPIDPRIWSLSGKPKRASDAPGIKVCKECYAANKAGAKTCSECGAEFQSQAASDPDVIEGELVAMKPKRLRPGDPVAWANRDGIFYVASDPKLNPQWDVGLALTRSAGLALQALHTAPLESLQPYTGPIKRPSSGAQTLEDLQAIEKEKGYKPGWAAHVWRSRMAKWRS